MGFHSNTSGPRSEKLTPYREGYCHKVGRGRKTCYEMSLKKNIAGKDAHWATSEGNSLALGTEGNGLWINSPRCGKKIRGRLVVSTSLERKGGLSQAMFIKARMEVITSQSGRKESRAGGGGVGGAKFTSSRLNLEERGPNERLKWGG